MPLLRPLLLGVVLPASITFVLLAITRQPWRRAKTPVGAWAGALAVGAGYLAGHLGILGLPPAFPRQAHEWFPYLAVCGGILGSAVHRLQGRRPIVAWIARAMLIALLLLALLRSLLRNQWQAWESACWLAALEVAGLFLWASFETLAQSSSTPKTCLVLIIVIAASAAVALLSGSALLAQLAGCLAAALCALLIVSLTAWRPVSPGGASVVVLFVLGGIWLNAYFYADVPTYSAVLLWAAPFTAWIIRIPRVKKLAPWQTTSLQIGLTLALVTLAVVIAFQSAVPMTDEAEY